MLLDQFAILREIEPPHSLSPDDVFAAIEHLCNAAGTLDECRKIMEEGMFDEALPQKLESAWNEVNQCRVYTEKIQFIDEVLVPVLGEINDAKCMFESLAAWGMGMTPAGYGSIMGCLFNAISGIRPCIEELSNWVPGSEEGGGESGGLEDPY